MSRTKVAIAIAGVIVVAGAAVAVSAPGHRGGGHGGHGGMMMHGDHEDGPMRGRFGRALTKEDFDARMRERFARLDRNSDGVIERAEVEAMAGERMEKRRGWRRQGGSNPGERMLRRFDADRDGKVTQAEVRAEFQRRFAEADLNSDGRIDDADLPPMMRGRNVIADGQRMGRGMGMGGLGWLRQADQNRDGVVTREEVAAFADREHARFDRNGDGAIDQADRDALRKEMAEYMASRFAHRNGGGQDGRVTREQFQAKAAERFARMDLDGDGVISRDERPGRWGHGWRGRHMGMGHGHGGGGMMGAPGEDGESDGRPGRGRGGDGPGRN